MIVEPDVVRTQCAACPWRDMATMRADHPETVAHAKTDPDGFVCHTRCGPCPGPALAGFTRPRVLLGDRQ